MFSKKNKAFTEAYSLYFPIVFSSIYTKVSNRDDAEDISQEVFLLFYDKLDEIQNTRKWLYGTLRLKVFEHYRKNNSNIVDIDEVFQDIGMTFVNGFKDVRILIKEAMENIDNFKDETERILFELVAVYRFSYSEAGAELGLSKRQVHYKYNQIIKKLLEYLNKKGIKSLEDLL